MSDTIEVGRSEAERMMRCIGFKQRNCRITELAVQHESPFLRELSAQSDQKASPVASLREDLPRSCCQLSYSIYM